MSTLTDLTVYARMARALQIFGQYEHEQGFDLQSDGIYAGPDPEDVTDEHVDELGRLGWTVSSRYGCFLYVS